MKVSWPRGGAVLVVAAGLVFGAAAPAGAHRGVLPTLHHDGRGTVWLTLAWDDGHPVTEPGLAMLSAIGDTGTTVPVTALRPLPHDPATLPLPGALAAGDWTVTVDVATPGVGYCSARVRVAADAVPQTLPCAPPATSSAVAAAPRTEGPPLVLVAALAAAALAAGVLWSRRPTRHRARTRDGRQV
ncbi:hypothetical protein [Catellatospora chokoriensis]|uniref:CopC domain-containing protein n=1 Tax=Catellatospora chokoriensis TaxID=310353 RepID=A0A8J3NVJ8_9ACTN|nr:hypothetical protein [Catellatospora chokoriensis]GIF94047.1 hypothetical protein Cch02nite_74910 [Catellatospora chokoriensis]